LVSGSQVVCLPCREGTIRGCANVNLIVLDEAARVPDDLYRAVRPVLEVPADRRGAVRETLAERARVVVASGSAG
jgi:hypothetical protein